MDSNEWHSEDNEESSACAKLKQNDLIELLGWYSVINYILRSGWRNWFEIRT